MMKTVVFFQNQNQSILHDWSNDWVKLHEDILKKMCLFGALNCSVDSLKELMIP